MLHDHDGAGLRTVRWIRVGSMLFYASVGLASAISGAAVALQLAPASPAGGSFARPAGAATPAGVAAAPMDKPGRLAAVVPSAGQATLAGGRGLISAPSATKSAPSAPTSTTAPLDERELTFAWGYAQRHPDAAASWAESHVGSAFAGARTQEVTKIAKSESRHRAERQRASPARRNTAGFAPSRFAADSAGDPHQALGYAEPHHADGFRIFSRAQSRPGPRHHSPS